MTKFKLKGKNSESKKILFISFLFMKSKKTFFCFVKVNIRKLLIEIKDKSSLKCMYEKNNKIK